MPTTVLVHNPILNQGISILQLLSLCLIFILRWSMYSSPNTIQSCLPFLSLHMSLSHPKVLEQSCFYLLPASRYQLCLSSHHFHSGTCHRSPSGEIIFILNSVNLPLSRKGSFLPTPNWPDLFLLSMQQSHWFTSSISILLICCT